MERENSKALFVCIVAQVSKVESLAVVQSCKVEVGTVEVHQCIVLSLRRFWNERTERWSNQIRCKIILAFVGSRKASVFYFRLEAKLIAFVGFKLKLRKCVSK